MALSGKAGRTRLRGRVDAGFGVPSRMRLEGRAPFGRPILILTSEQDRAVLTLPRDGRVLTGATAAEIVEALAGVPLDADALRTIVSGCGIAVADAPTEGRSERGGLAAVTLGNSTTVPASLGQRVADRRRNARDAFGLLLGFSERAAGHGEPSGGRVRGHGGHHVPPLADRNQSDARSQDVSAGHSRRCHAVDDRRAPQGWPLGEAGTALKAAISDDVSMTRPTPLTTRAHAKVNLDLRVLGTRADGFHELRTVFQTIELHDTLIWAERPGPFTVKCRTTGSAARREQSRVAGGRRVVEGARARRRGRATRSSRSTSRFPMQAGLGGGSADAAAALARACAVVGRRAADASCARSAPTIGADVPFFLSGGTALGLGLGEEIYPLVDLPPHWIVIVRPPFGVSTAEAYAWYDDDRAAGLRGDARAADAAGAVAHAAPPR